MSLSLGFAQVWTRTREKASADLRESFGLLRQEKCQRKYSIVLARLHFEFYSRYEQLTRPISKARALGWETGLTFCSRGPDRQLACPPSQGDSLLTREESSVCKQVAALRHASTLSRIFPW